MPPTSCFFGTGFVLNPFFLLAGALLFDEKSAKGLHYFSLHCGMLEFLKYSAHEPSSKEQLLTVPDFWSPVWRKRLRFVPIQPVCRKKED
jgi:hypothetical protein